MSSYKTPAVYVKEIATLPPSVAPVSTAIPAFIGYTEKRLGTTDDSAIVIEPINNWVEYQTMFGGAYSELKGKTITVDDVNTPTTIESALPTLATPTFWLYYQVRMFFQNGGGRCYMVSLGTYEDTSKTIKDGLDELEKYDEPTLVVIPDAIRLTSDNFYSAYQEALNHCVKMQDRFALIDTYVGNVSQGVLDGPISEARTGLTITDSLKYGACYYPWLRTNLEVEYNELDLSIHDGGGETDLKLSYDLDDLASLSDFSGTDREKREAAAQKSLFHLNRNLYDQVVASLSKVVDLPPSGAVAGLYARVDRTRGVYKSPANESLQGVQEVLARLNRSQTDNLNVDSSGKSVNVIRPIRNRGAAVVMGARTLDATSNEWRYVSVRRYFLFAEESIKKAVIPFTFEPNTADTWQTIRGMIENFLRQQWTEGALAGSTPRQAYYVRIGLGETMSPDDVLNGRLIVEIGLAVVRPAEFILLKFTHLLQEA